MIFEAKFAFSTLVGIKIPLGYRSCYGKHLGSVKDNVHVGVFSIIPSISRCAHLSYI